MKKILFLLALLILGTTAMAQQHLVGITGGVNISNTLSNMNFSFKAGPLAGLDYEYNSKGIFTINSGIWFNQTGNASYVTFTNEVGQEIKEVRGEMRANSISIPLAVGIKTKKKTYFFGNVGIVPSLLLNARLVSKESLVNVNLPGGENVDISNQYRNFDIPFQLQLGAGVCLNEKMSIQTGLMFQYSILKVIGTEGNRFGNHYGFTPILYLRYKLGGEK
jgi:hypothetical protein